ncbi:YitT family protein [Microbacterium invictum]|uniref:Uncharacterized membrane-anchored protein YitT (DUF2179 family) n=1 Tax=Microbacterium invictum TaxID=515415 RepID=A0AA40SQ54_9MICO|nr:YitT family protein [Microbacterium invictum]MBB4140205.1 uncharacterized membrane-anchored protein YitT (DUF2179 family) [Microbacterium invictum]
MSSPEPDPEPEPESESGSEASSSLVFEERAAPHTLADDVLGILTGTFAASLGLHLLNASEAVTGGTAGLSLLLGYATGWPFWVLFAVINIPFAVLAVWKKGWNFTIRTVISIALVSGFSVLHEQYFVIAELQPLYGTLAGNLLAGIGMLILFRHRSSVGGIHVVGLVIQERTGFRAGWTLMMFDVVIILLALLVVPWPNVLMSAAGAVLLNLVLALNHRPGRYIGR